MLNDDIDSHPEVKALRDENERLKLLASRLDGQLGKRPCQNNRCAEFNRLESQLAELRQGGEAMIQELRDLQSRIHFDPLPRFNVPDEIDRIIDNFRADADPQPAIPPGYAAVQELRTALTDLIDAVEKDVKVTKALNYARDALASAPAIQPQAAESVPVAETDESQRVYAECRQCYRCNHIGINDAHDTHSSCHDCDWNGPSPEEDHCPACHADGTMMAACPKCSGTYELQADAYIDAAMLTAPADSKEGK